MFSTSAGIQFTAFKEISMWVIPVGIVIGVWASMGLWPGVVALLTMLIVCTARSMAPSARAVQASIIAVCFALAGCGGNGESEAEAAAKEWLDALNDGNITAAQEMSTEQTKMLIQMSNSMGQSLAVGEYEIVEVKMVNDTSAEVVVSSEKNADPMSLDLVKIDGKWKVGVRK